MKHINRKRLRRLSALAALLLCLYWLGAAVMLPYLARPRVERLVSEALDCSFSVESIDLHPFTLTVGASGVRLAGRDEAPIFSADRIAAGIRLRSLLSGGVLLDELTLVQPTLTVSRGETGQLNLATLVPPRDHASDEIEGEPLLVQAGAVRIERGTLTFHDRTKAEPFEFRVSGLDGVMLNVSTRSDEATSYAVTAELGNDGRLDWRGTAVRSPLRVEGEVKVEGLILPQLVAHFGGELPVSVESGEATWRARYELGTSGGESVHRVDGEVKFEDLALGDRAGTPLFRAGEVTLSGFSVDLDRRHIALGSVALAAPTLTIERDQGGKWSLPDSASQSRDNTPPAERNTPWSFAGGTFDVRSGTVQFTDRSVDPPVIADLQSLAVKGRLPAGGNALSFDGSLRLKEGGKLSLDGSFTPETGAFAVKTELEKIPLTLAAGYVAREAAVTVHSGVISFRGNVERKPNGGDAPQLSVSGSLNLWDLNAEDSNLQRPLITLEEGSLQDLLFTTSPPALLLGATELTHASVSVLRTEAGLNVSRLLRRNQGGAVPSASSSPPASQSAESGQPLALAVGPISFTDGVFEYAQERKGGDDFSFVLRALNGSVVYGREASGQASPGRVQVSLRATADNAPLTFEGEGDLEKPSAHRSFGGLLTLKDYELTELSSLLEEFFGYPIDRGVLKAEVRLKVAGEKLTGENSFLLKNFELGDPGRGENVTDLPLQLAVALLTDSKGRIEISLPVTGQIGTPAFSYRTLLLKGLRGLIAEAVASPFTLLASLAGTSEEEAREVEFAPGSGELSAAEQAKLRLVAQAFQQRPELELEIQAIAFREGELPPLPPQADGAVSSPDDRALLSLAKKRAKRTRDFLLTECGLEARRVVRKRSKVVDGKAGSVVIARLSVDTVEEETTVE